MLSLPGRFGLGRDERVFDLAGFGTSWRLGIFTACAVSVLLLLGALVGRWPSGHLTLLRVVVSVVAPCLVVVAYEEGRPGWAILFGLAAFLFNPLMPIRMRRADWRLLNIGGIVLLAAAAFRFGRGRMD
jgi:hypothetical protein